MKSRICSAALLVFAVLVGAPAHAKDVCVQAGTAKFVFKKVKALKKPGAVVPLQGIYILGGSIPATGTAIVRADGSVVFGVLVHTTPPLGAYAFTASLEGDASFTASGTFEATDGSIGAGMSWTPIDCKTVVLE
jgi:hypothetical protein